MSVDQPQTPPEYPDESTDPQTREQPAEAQNLAGQPDAPQAAAGEPAEVDLKGELEDMRRRFAELEGRVTSGQLTAAPQDEQLKQRVSQLRQEYADWPKKGDEGKDMPQPWDLKEHGIPRPGVDRDYLPGGQPDEISPVVVSHNQPILTSGMAGPAVAELGALLGRLGYPNTIAQGRNHSFHFDDSIAAAVGSFAREHNVKEDPSQFPPQHDPDGYVGPWMWEAVLRAAARLEEEKQAA